MGIAARWHVRSGVYYGLLSGRVPGETGLVDLFAPHAPGRMGIALSTRRDRRVRDRVPARPPGRGDACRAAYVGWSRSPTGCPRCCSPAARRSRPRLLSETLGPILALPKAQSQTLLDTLSALLQHDGSPTHAASDLYCHRNTVIYRMKQIEQLTSRSLTDPRDKMLLGLALMANGRG